jgi:hypothetical protein
MRSLRLIPLAILTILMAHACTQQPSIPTAEILTQTMEAAASLIAGMQSTPASTAQVGLNVVTPAPTLTPENTATPVIDHFSSPGEPKARTSALGDRSSAPFAEQKRTIGDDFNANLYERPFSAEEMVYLDYLDIAPGADLSFSPPWIYVSIYLVGAPPKDAKAMYAVELDLNLDARGDWLITASAPHSTEWTTSGVRVYVDSNGDVGGKKPMQAESPPQTGDGYDTQIFDQGVGPDPDAAWVRLSPNEPVAIQFAFKHTFIGTDYTLIWGVWADGGLNNPEWFDYNDHFTYDEAGSPVASDPHYPLQAIASIDNTCRWIQGIVPRPGMPGMCK